MRGVWVISVVVVAAVALLAVASAGADPAPVTPPTAADAQYGGLQVQTRVAVANAVAGAHHTVRKHRGGHARRPLVAVQSAATLPFTGLPLGGVAGFGAALVGGGLLLRRRSPKR